MRQLFYTAAVILLMHLCSRDSAVAQTTCVLPLAGEYRDRIRETYPSDAVIEVAEVSPPTFVCVSNGNETATLAVSYICSISSECEASTVISALIDMKCYSGTTWYSTGREVVTNINSIESGEGCSRCINSTEHMETYPNEKRATYYGDNHCLILHKCYSAVVCNGTQIDKYITQRECCLDIEDGYSYMTAEECSLCIVHGIERGTYEVNEGESVTITIKRNVKGTSNFPLIQLGGNLTSESGTNDIVPFHVSIPTLDGIQYEVRTVDDEIASERGVTVTVKYEHVGGDEFTNLLEQTGEYFRLNATIEIIDNDAIYYNVTLERDTVTTIEGNIIEVCVVLTPFLSTQDLTFPLTVPVIVTFRTVDSISVSQKQTNGAPQDFEGQNITLEFSNSRRMCTTVTTIDDDVVELDSGRNRETFFVILEPSSPNGMISGIDRMEIRIRDNDEITVALDKQTYTVYEDQGYLTVCGVVQESDRECPFEFPAPLAFSTFSGTADNGEDYEPLAKTAEVPVCEDKVCVNITIIDDAMLEETGTFFVTLERNAILPFRRVRFLPENTRSKVYILDDETMYNVTLEQETITVSEGDGTVEVCAVLSPFISTQKLSFPLTAPLIVTFRTVDNISVSQKQPNGAPQDFNGQNIQLKFSNSSHICTTVIIFDDNTVELDSGHDRERFDVVLEPFSPNVKISGIDRTEVRIRDNDEIAVALDKQTYAVDEDQGFLTVCGVVLDRECPFGFPAPLGFSTFADSAVSDQDFQPLYEVAEVPVCEDRVCVNITIIDDSIVEDTETFYITLERNARLPFRRVIFLPNNSKSRVNLFDDEILISVGYAVNEYITTEGTREVWLFIKIFHPPSGQAPRPFTLFVNTHDSTAVSPDDYVPVREQLIHFNTGDRSHFHIITIEQDRICEDSPNEYFFSNLLLVSGSQPINVSRSSSRVVIDDSMDRCCRTSVTSVSFQPVNGTVVRVSWSGRDDLATTLEYTSYFNETGAVMSRYEEVLDAGTTSTYVTLDDAVDGYKHNFALQHIIRCDVITQPTVATFTFDKKNFQIQFGPIDYCLNWGLRRIRDIEHQLQTQLIRIIREHCADCYSLSRRYLRQGQFFCHSNPTTVTYRSTLVNPFPTVNATQLVGIIQSWVSKGSSLVFNGLKMEVNPDCPTSISSFDDAECVGGVETGSTVSQGISQVLGECAVRQLGEEICGV